MDGVHAADLSAEIDTDIATHAGIVDARHVPEAIPSCLTTEDNGGPKEDIVFDGCNVHVRDGSNDGTDGVNGLGNLIVGYNENVGLHNRNGSHNLVIGPEQTYSSYGGLVEMFFICPIPPTGPILDTLEVLNNPHLNQRGTIVEFNHPERGKFKMCGCPVKMSKSIPEYTAAPLLGQHNEEVYAEWMGYSKEAVAKLKEEGVIEKAKDSALPVELASP